MEKVFAISGLKMVILGFLRLGQVQALQARQRRQRLQALVRDVAAKGQTQWMQLSAISRTWFAFCRTKECLKLVVFKPAKDITDQGLQAMSSLTSLQNLNLTACSKITDQGLQALLSLVSLQPGLYILQ